MEQFQRKLDELQVHIITIDIRCASQFYISLYLVISMGKGASRRRNVHTRFTERFTAKEKARLS